MEPPIYDGKIHPNEYIKKMRSYCNFKQITNEQTILNFAIMNVDSTINITKNITSFDTLLNTLKRHISFTVFKNSCKRKLQTLKYVTERDGGNTVNFVVDFRTLCRDAEITNIEEQKKYLFNALPYNFFKNEFAKRQKNVNSMDELINIFENIVSEYSKIIRNGSIVALKHIVTGKYLSSCDKKYPQNNNNRTHQTHHTRNPGFANNDAWGNFGYKNNDENMVYCGDFGPNALWSIRTSNPVTIPIEPANPIDYKGLIRLQHKIYSKKCIITDISGKSPISNHFKVCCNNNFQYSWIVKNCHNNDNQGNVKSQDIILLQWDSRRQNRRQQQLLQQDFFLRSHDFKFAVDNENYQEVITHDQRIGGNDQWCIELIEQADDKAVSVEQDERNERYELYEEY